MTTAERQRSRVGGRGLALMLGSALSFGGAGVFGKAAMAAAPDLLTPIRLAQFRITAAAAVLLLLVLALRAGGSSDHRIRWDRTTFVLVVAYGLLGFVGVQLFFFISISRMPIGITLLIEYLAPALVALYALLVQHRPQHRTIWIGIGAALVGLGLIARPWNGFTLDGLGVLAALAAALALAGYFLIAESAGDRIPPLTLAAMACTVAAVVMAVVQPWWTFPWQVLAGTSVVGGADVPVWLLLTVLVLVGTVLAYALGIAALRVVPAPIASVVATLEVVIASVSAWLLLGEALSAVEIGGGALLLAGAVLAQRSSARRG